MKNVSKDKNWIYIIWNPKSKISIIEYVDLECPTCKIFHFAWIINSVIESYWDNINFSFRHFPLNIHKQASMEAEALECIADLWWKEKFFSWLNLIFLNSKTSWDSYTKETISELSKNLWLDQNKVFDCINSWKFSEKVQSQRAEWLSIWVKWTPWILIKNNETWKSKMVFWLYPFEQLKAEIDSVLK